MKHYGPGQSVRTSLTSTSLGSPIDPSSPAVTVTFPDGTTTNPSPVKDSLGLWHADFLVPLTMATGIGTIVWRSSGAQTNQNAVTDPPEYFAVDVV